MLSLLLAARSLNSPDLAYHLAYGERLLDVGEIIDANPFIYTLEEHRGAPPADRPEPGPGAWWDGTDYRFANANWLSQAAMAVVNRLLGAGGLCALQMVLVAIIIAACAATMRRLRLPWNWTAAGVFLIAMVAYFRFDLRPELFGHAVLSVELLVTQFARASRAGERRWWLPATALVPAQLLLVNLHSYFPLGLALTGAFLVEALLCWGWARLAGRREEDAPPHGVLAARLVLVLLAQAAVCFANPWTWRLAVLPIETVLYIHRHNITAATGGMGHPWALITELFSPFGGDAFARAKATKAFYVLLVVAAAGGVAAVWRRRWAWLLVTGGMVAAAFPMRRNMAPAAILAVPVALAALHEALANIPLMARRSRLRRAAALVASAFVAAACVWFAAGVVTQRFYTAEGSRARFGFGFAPTVIPLAACDWLNEQRPEGRLWTGFAVSSSYHYFTRPHRDVPLVTNTWAYPPEVMRRVVEFNFAHRPFGEAARRYGIEIVALRVDRAHTRQAAALNADPAWALVFLDGWDAIFLRRAGPNAALAERARRRAEAGELHAALDDFQQARRYFYEALQICPGFEPATRNAAMADRDIAALRRRLARSPGG